MRVYRKAINKLLRLFELKFIPNERRVVYLTFDDGPEPDITEFVLRELDKYGFKATFFCRGDNAEKFPVLLAKLIESGHAIGNHTYSHLHVYDTSSNRYIEDVERADAILQTNLFRPPYGSLTFRTWWKLHNRKIVFWTLNSCDSDMTVFNYERSIENLKSNTYSGVIVLFHFCHKHENETKLLLPQYLKWLEENGYKSFIISQ